MAYKILEQNGIDNENTDGAAFNNFSAGNRDGIIKDVLNECALSSTGNIISVATGEMILHGFRVKITAAETLSVASAPAARTEYQIVAEVTLSDNHAVAFTLFFQLPQALVQNPMFDTDLGTYQAELGRFYQETDGSISGLRRTLPVIYADSEKYAEEAKEAAEQAQAAAEEAQEGAAQAKLDIPLSPEQTGVAITGKNTLAGAGVSVVLESRNLFNIDAWDGTSIQTGGYIQNIITLSDGIFTNPISQYNNLYSPNIQIPVKKGKVTVSAEVQCPEEGYLQFSFGFGGPTEMAASTEYKALTAEDTEWHNYQATFDVGKDGICYFACANRTATTGENYAVNFRNIQVELGETATPYTPYLSDGTSVNVTACGKNILYTENGTVQNDDYVVNANNGEITFTRGETYVGIWKISNEIGWSTTGNYVNDWKGETVYGGSDPLVMSWSYEGNIDRTGYELYPRIVPIYKDGTVNDQIQVFAQNSITLEAKPIAAIALFMSGTIPDGWKIKVQLSKTAIPYTPYTGATYPATVGQSVEIVQYDKITNVFTDNAGVTVSAAFKQSTRYELDDRLVPLFGAFASRPTDIQPYARLYVATDQTGDNKVTILPANTDGSVSGNWITI